MARLYIPLPQLCTCLHLPIGFLVAHAWAIYGVAYAKGSEGMEASTLFTPSIAGCLNQIAEADTYMRSVLQLDDAGTGLVTLFESAQDSPIRRSGLQLLCIVLQCGCMGGVDVQVFCLGKSQAVKFLQKCKDTGLLSAGRTNQVPSSMRLAVRCVVVTGWTLFLCAMHV